MSMPHTPLSAEQPLPARQPLPSRQPWRLMFAEGTQWFTFAIASFISAPVLVANVLRLDHHGTATLIQSAVLVGGVGALWQLFWGHKYMLNVVPGLIWAAVALGLTRFAATDSGPLTSLLTDLQGALLVTGLVFIILAFTGVVRHLVRLLTPLTMAAYLLLLTVQAAPAIVRDALAVGFYGPGPDPAATIASIILILLFLILSHPRRPRLYRTLALPLAVIGGWIALTAAGLVWPPGATAGAVAGSGATAASATGAALPWLQVPIFPWGPPTFRPSLIVAVLPNVLPILAGMSSAVVAVSQVYGHEAVDPRGLQRSVAGIGLFTMAAASNSPVGPVLQAEGAGFIAMTGMRRWQGFAVGMIFVTTVGLSPALAGVLAAIPKSLFAAALAAGFSAMGGIAVRTLLRGPTTQRELTIFGIALMFGIGAAFMPAGALLVLPLSLRYLLSNGMIVGVLVALLLEHVLFPRPWEERPDPGRVRADRAATD